MRTRVVRVGIPATLLLLSITACGTDEEVLVSTTVATAATTETTTPVTTPSTAPSTAPTTAPTTASSGPAATDAPAATTAPDDGTVRIDVTVGTDSGADRIEQVPLGSTVVLTITDPVATQEYHVHGFDLGDDREFEPGQVATFTFTADTAGEFEVESHITDALLVVLQVS
jgi:hypothetical protein